MTGDGMGAGAGIMGETGAGAALGGTVLIGRGAVCTEVVAEVALVVAAFGTGAGGVTFGGEIERGEVVPGLGVVPVR
jgi:hypothetical protein